MRYTLPLLAALAMSVPMTMLPSEADAQSRRSLDPRREAAEALLKPMTVSFTDARLDDVMMFFQDFTGASFDVMWIDDRNVDGLDPDSSISLNVRDMPALNVLERVLKQAYQGFDGATWQFSEDGELQVGPKSRLNALATLKLYDIRDLLFRVESFSEVPDLGLGQIIQGQGGGSQSADFQYEERPRGTEDEEAQEIINLIVQFVEPDQWRDNGGDGGSITFYNGNLLVRAPDYIHRQLVGYSFWPSDSRGRSARLSEQAPSTFEVHVESEQQPALATEKPESQEEK